MYSGIQEGGSTGPAGSDVGTKTADVLPPLKNPRVLVEVRRVKLGTASKRSNSGLVTLELINDQGARVSLERVYVTETYWRASVRDPMGDYLQLGLANYLKDLDTRSVEVLCIEVDELRDGEAPAVDMIKETLDRSESVKTLILSYAAVKLRLLALGRDAGANEDSQRFPQVQTLVVGSRSSRDSSGFDTLRTLLPVAQRRKEAGYPFKSTSVFLLDELSGEGEGRSRRC